MKQYQKIWLEELNTKVTGITINDIINDDTGHTDALTQKLAKISKSAYTVLKMVEEDWIRRPDFGFNGLTRVEVSRMV